MQLAALTNRLPQPNDGESRRKRATVIDGYICAARPALNARHSLNIADVRRRFDRAADSFDGADFVHAVTRDGLFARLEPVVVDASGVVDRGCATGAATRRLEKRFRGARVLGVGLSLQMLERARARRGWFSKASFLHADARALPLAANSADVVFSNLLLPWMDEPADLGREVARVLRKDGLFAFATLGPDSLLELRRAWAEIDDYDHVNRFPDMHDVGDALGRAGLRDPVLDVDRLQVSYESPAALYRDLSAAGARNSLAARRHSLSGRAAFAALQRRLGSDASDGAIWLDLELVYGHCWGGGGGSRGTDVHIDPAAIPIRRG